MREHMGLYRGKRKDNSEWVEGGYSRCNKDGSTFITIMGKDHISYFGFHAEVDPDTVGECTGLKDKNDKLIFEGDIIKFGDNPLIVFWNDEAFGWYAKKLVDYVSMQFYINCSDWNYIDLGWIAAEVPCIGKMTTEVIGNIHDNPELLKGESNG